MRSKEEELNIIERKDYVRLSRMSGGRGTSRFFGGALILWGIGLLYILIFDPGKLIIGQMSFLIYLFAFGLIIGGGYMIKSTYTIVNYINHEFDERRILKGLTIKRIPGLIAMAVFSSLFIAVGVYGAPLPFLIFGVFFGIVLIAGAIYGQILTRRRLKSTEGPLASELKYLSRTPFRLGDNLDFELLNSSPRLQGVAIVATLRFLEEKYLRKRNRSDSSSTLKTVNTYEDQTTVFLEGGRLECSFSVPASGVSSTDLDYSEPKYWELEFMNEGTSYYARFVLDVK